MRPQPNGHLDGVHSERIMAKASQTATLLMGWQIQKEDRWVQRQALEALLRARRGAFQELSAAPPEGADPVDAARAQEEEMVWLAVMERNHGVQVQVLEALRRLVRGEYGLCADCAERISAPRLRALPFALRCLRCQERWEAENDRSARPLDPFGIRSAVAGQDC